MKYLKQKRLIANLSEINEKSIEINANDPGAFS